MACLRLRGKPVHLGSDAAEDLKPARSSAPACLLHCPSPAHFCQVDHIDEGHGKCCGGFDAISIYETVNGCCTYFVGIYPNALLAACSRQDPGLSRERVETSH